MQSIEIVKEDLQVEKDTLGSLLGLIFFGQLLFVFLSFYFQVKSPLIIAWLGTFFIICKLYYKNQIKFCPTEHDAVTFLFFTGVLINFLFLGKADAFDFLKKMLMFMLLPYITGKLVLSNITVKWDRVLHVITSVYIVVLIHEFLKNPGFFYNSDRLRLFLIGESGTGGDGTAYYLGLCFGATFVVSVYNILMSYKNRTSLSRVNLFFIFILPPALFLLASRSSFLISLCISFLLCVVMLRLSYVKILSTAFIFLLLVFIGFKSLGGVRQQLMSELLDVAPWSRVGILCDESAGSIGVRKSFIRESIKLIELNPIMGIGAGNFGMKYCTLEGDAPSVVSETRDYFESPHSLFLQFFVEYGVLCTGVLLVGWFLLLKDLIPKLAAQENSIQGLNFCILALYLLLQFQVTGNIYYDYQFFLILGCFAGLAVTVSKRVE